MKNYFKKFSIMFVMLLTVIGVGAIQNGTVVYATATLQKSLPAVEDNSWERYDDTDSKIFKVGKWLSEPLAINHNGTAGYTTDTLSIGEPTAMIKFYGSKIRIMSGCNVNRGKNINVFIDNMNVGQIDESTPSNISQVLVFQKLDLTMGEHTVELISGDGKYQMLDAIDINKDGKLLQASESINIDEPSIGLTVGAVDTLTVTTTSSADITWASSDTSVATVDENGNVTAISEGTCAITATIYGTTISDTCEVTVTAKDVPTDPDEPKGNGKLFIELVDGNIKQYDVDDSEISKFIKWYNDRDNTDSEPPYYKFTKGDYKDYVIHDKIDWFEVR